MAEETGPQKILLTRQHQQRVTAGYTAENLASMHWIDELFLKYPIAE